MTGTRDAKSPTSWTRRLQLITVVCSAVFTLGTVLHGWLVVNPETLELMMRLSGASAAQAAADAPGFLTGFRIVAVVYVVGNAIGMLALRGWRWVFWVALLINITQAAGPFGLIPAVMFEAAQQSYGAVGLLPSIVTDVGAFLLAATLLISLIRFRSVWAYRRTSTVSAAPDQVATATLGERSSN